MLGSGTCLHRACGQKIIWFNHFGTFFKSDAATWNAYRAHRNVKESARRFHIRHCVRLCRDVIEWWVFDSVERRSHRNRRGLVAQLERGNRRGRRFRRRLHAAARVPGQILTAESGQGRRCRWKADTAVQATAEITQSHSYAADASLPSRRQSGTGNSHPGRLSR